MWNCRNTKWEHHIGSSSIGKNNILHINNQHIPKGPSGSRVSFSQNSDLLNLSLLLLGSTTFEWCHFGKVHSGNQQSRRGEENHVPQQSTETSTSTRWWIRSRASNFHSLYLSVWGRCFVCVCVCVRVWITRSQCYILYRTYTPSFRSSVFSWEKMARSPESAPAKINLRVEYSKFLSISKLFRQFVNPAYNGYNGWSVLHTDPMTLPSRFSQLSMASPEHTNKQFRDDADLISI